MSLKKGIVVCEAMNAVYHWNFAGAISPVSFWNLSEPVATATIHKTWHFYSFSRMLGKKKKPKPCPYSQSSD